MGDPELRNLTLAIAMNGVVAFSALTWSAVFLIRTHGVSTLEAGLILAAMFGVVGALGTFLSGRLADRIRRHDPAHRITLMVVAAVAAKPFALAFLFSDTLAVALAAMAVSVTLSSVYWGPTLAHLHARVDVVMRPMATTTLLFCYNVCGVMIGPFIVGLVSDGLGPHVGGDGLRYGMAAVQLAGLLTAWHYWRVGRIAFPPVSAARLRPDG